MLYSSRGSQCYGKIVSLEVSDLWSQTLVSEKHLEDFNLSVTIASEDLLERVSLLPIPSEKKRVDVENVNVTFIVSPPQKRRCLPVSL